MNYTVIVMSGFTIVLSLAWVFEGRKLYSPPRNEEEILVAEHGVLHGLVVHEDEENMNEFSKSQAKSHITPLSEAL